MAGTLSVSYLDAQNDTAFNHITVASSVDAALLLPKLKAISNCKITSAHYSEAMDVSALAGNNAVAANNESALTKTVVTMSGPNPTAGLPRITSTIQVPAPIGSLVSGNNNVDKANAAVTTLLAQVLANRGETLDSVDTVAYAK